MSTKYHSIHKNDLARAMVAQSEQAFLAIAQGNAPRKATSQILEYSGMAPFFIKRECDEPPTAVSRLRWIEALWCLFTGGKVTSRIIFATGRNDQRRRRYSEALYTWLVTSEQEQLVCDALVHLGPVETEQGLHAEGVRTIQEVLHCTLDDARATLRELRVRKRIEETATPVEPLDQPHFRWVRPSA